MEKISVGKEMIKRETFFIMNLVEDFIKKKFPLFI